VLALIGAKEKEHDAQRLSSDARDNMEPALVKWTRIAEEIAKAGCSTFPRGPLACRDKWQTLFSDYKKIYDYKGATGNNEDYFRMSSRRRKELMLPPNFVHAHFQEMQKFLSQRPSLNPPHQRDSLDDNDHVHKTPAQLMEYCASHGIDPETLQDDDFADPVLQQGLVFMAGAGGSSTLPPLPEQSWKGKETVEMPLPPNMKADRRPPNMAVKRRQTSSQTRMVDVTESQGRQIVTSMQKLSEVEDKKVDIVGHIADKQLEYFKIRDREIAANQCGLVSTVSELSRAIGMEWQHRNSSPPFTPDHPPPTDNIGGTAPTGQQSQPRNGIPEWDAPRLEDLPNDAGVFTPRDIQHRREDKDDEDMCLIDSHGDRIASSEDQYMEPTVYVDIDGRPQMRSDYSTIPSVHVLSSLPHARISES
jgi:hypothetical protein